MKPELENIDMELIAFLQGDIPLMSRPYAAIAAKCGCTEEQILKKIENWLGEGRIRRFAAVLRHNQAGYVVNAMIAWQIDPEQADMIGQIMASFQQVSHCYLRRADERFPYNLYTMVHSRSQNELEETINSMKKVSGIDDCQVLTTTKELKKISMQYV